MQTKECNTCRLPKPLEAFYANPHLRDGYANQCKKCHVEANKVRRHANPEANRIYSRERQRAWRQNNPGRARELSKAWQEKNRERHLATRRAARLRKLYKVTPEFYALMVQAQGGRCLICGKIPEATAHTPGLHVDHNHETGEVRGLLCNNCNRALGWFQDSIPVLKAAIVYLERFLGALVPVAVGTS
jgi:hypothetical protein